MTGGLRAAGRAMMNYATRHDVIANNLANVSTDGFARQETLFARLAAEARAPLAAPEVSTRTDFTPGPPIITGRPLDFSLEGSGFFAVSTPRGERYTRFGSFTVDAEGMLRDSAGNLVLGESGALFVGDEPVYIEGDGQVIVQGNALDRLKLATFSDGADLIREAQGLYAARAGALPNPEMERPLIHPGQLEGSSVEPVTELVRMIAALRSYEAAAAAVRSTDRTVELAVNEIARV
jgi:flagellar basal body rod protein FlgG